MEWGTNTYLACKCSIKEAYMKALTVRWQFSIKKGMNRVAQNAYLFGHCVCGEVWVYVYMYVSATLDLAALYPSV